jgi:hypothetical protein
VDAICINQEDVRERGHQVRLMRAIYKNAKRVLIWIGKDELQYDELGKEPPPSAPIAFEIIHQIVDNMGVRDVSLIKIEWEAGLVPKAVFKPRTRKPPVYTSSWATMEELVSSPWFWRLWIIQEVAVSPSSTLIWGDEQIQWELVGEACNWLKTNYPLSRRIHIFGAYNAAYIYNLAMQAREGKLHPFLNVMVSIWLFDSTDLRDRVFALLGLHNSDSDPDNDALLLDPDYSLSTSQVYLALARRLLEREQTLRLFGAAQHDPAKPLNTRHGYHSGLRKRRSRWCLLTISRIGYLGIPTIVLKYRHQTLSSW